MRLTSGGRQTKFPLLRRSNLPAAPGVMTSGSMIIVWGVGIILLSMLVLRLNEKLREWDRLEDWVVPPILVFGCILTYLIGLMAVIIQGGTIRELLLYPLIIPGVVVCLCAVMVAPLWADILAVIIDHVDDFIKRIFKRS